MTIVLSAALSGEVKGDGGRVKVPSRVERVGRLSTGRAPGRSLCAQVSAVDRIGSGLGTVGLILVRVRRRVLVLSPLLHFSSTDQGNNTQKILENEEWVSVLCRWCRQQLETRFYLVTSWCRFVLPRTAAVAP